MIRVGSHYIDKAGQIVVCRSATADVDVHRQILARTYNNMIGTDPVISFRFINGQAMQPLTLSAESARQLMFLLMGAFNVHVEDDKVHTNLESFTIDKLPFPFTAEQHREYLDSIEDADHAQEEQAEEHPAPTGR